MILSIDSIVISSADSIQSTRGLIPDHFHEILGFEIDLAEMNFSLRESNFSTIHISGCLFF